MTSSEHPRAFGVFHAVGTRDAVGRARDIWPYFQKNLRGHDQYDSLIYEIQFGDGEWTLALGEE